MTGLQATELLNIAHEAMDLLRLLALVLSGGMIFGVIALIAIAMRGRP